MIVASGGEHHLRGMWRESPQLTFAMTEDQRSRRVLIHLDDIGSLQTHEYFALRRRSADDEEHHRRGFSLLEDCDRRIERR